MKVGDLVQPGSRGYDTKTGCMKPMRYHIKGEYGIIVGMRDELSALVYFPKFGYQHPVSWRALELIDESR